MKTYSVDLQQKIVAAYDQGLGSQRQLAKTFGGSRAFVEKLFQLSDEPVACHPSNEGDIANPCWTPPR